MGSACSSEVRTELLGEHEKTLPDLSGKKVAITGTTSGIGLVAARTCLSKGAAVFLLNRKSKRQEERLEALQREFPEGVVRHVACDLANFGIVRYGAKNLLSQCGSELDVLCCNAGTQDFSDEATKDGFDPQMQTNYLSHFLLVKELLPALKNAAEMRGEARIIQRSSIERFGSALDVACLSQDLGKFSGAGPDAGKERHHQSKLAQVVFAYALEAKLAAAGHSKIKSCCCTSGSTSKMMNRMTSCVSEPTFQSIEDGTMPMLSAIAAEGVQSGDMFTPSFGNLDEEKGPVKTLRRPLVEERHAVCTDATSQEALWRASEAAVGGAFRL